MLLKQNTHLHSSICIFYKEVPHVRTWFSIVVAPSANKTLQKIKTKWKYRENWIYLSNFIDREAYLFELVIISGNLNMSKVPGPQVTMPRHCEGGEVVTIQASPALESQAPLSCLPPSWWCPQPWFWASLCLPGLWRRPPGSPGCSGPSASGGHSRPTTPSHWALFTMYIGIWTYKCIHQYSLVSIRIIHMYRHTNITSVHSTRYK